MNKLVGQLVEQTGSKPKAKASKAVCPPTGSKKSAPEGEHYTPPSGLDPQAVHQALQAGVIIPNAIACTAEEEEPEAGGDAAGSGDLVGTAVVHLTKLVKNMQDQKKEKKNRSLDALLDSSARGWLERWSRVQGYQTSVTFGWVLAGICVGLPQSGPLRRSKSSSRTWSSHGGSACL